MKINANDSELTGAFLCQSRVRVSFSNSLRFRSHFVQNRGFIIFQKSVLRALYEQIYDHVAFLDWIHAVAFAVDFAGEPGIELLSY